MTTSDPYPEIRYPSRLSLSEAELALLALAFANSDEVLVERELRAGFSGARVLLVKPGHNQAEVVAKLGPTADLRREWAAYKTLVEDYLPQNTAHIQGEPILSSDGQQGLLRYTFAGGDPHQPTGSLRTYYQEQGGAAAAETLNRVFRVFGRQWWLRNEPHTFALGEEYDRLLPVHLRLRLTASDEIERIDGDVPIILTAGEVSVPTLGMLHLGQRVRLLNFRVDEIRTDQQDMTLIAPPPPREASAHLRLRVKGIDPATYHSGAPVDTVDAVVTATRHSLLVDGIRARVDPQAEEIQLGKIVYPNPLIDYPDYLDQVTEARFSIIHGDLNLENILVESSTGFAWLIDFADTRRGPALFDLQRLEGQVISKLLPPVFNQAGLGPEIIAELYHALHTDSPQPNSPHPALQEAYTFLVAIRRLARQFLMNDVDWDEYYRGLILTLLGTLKFAELEAPARALVFAGAATARGLMGTPLSAPLPVPTKPKSKLGHPWLVIVPLAFLMTILAVMAGWLWWQSNSTPEHQAPLALIISITGRVEVRRQVDDRVQPATFGLYIYSQDAVLTYEAATVYVLCENGLLFNLGPSQTRVINCQETADNSAVGQMDPHLSNQLIQASEQFTITLAPATTRADRAEIGRGPILVGPRNTAIIEPWPTLHWNGVTGANRYHLMVANAVTNERWEIETTETALTYPADAPPLVPDATYITRLRLSGADSQVDETFFYLLDETDRKDVIAAEENVRALSMDPVTTSFLLAEIYQQWKLWDAAIAQLETIAAKEEISGLAAHLGDLYFNVGLYTRAESGYQAALNEAQAANDLAAQAGALVGLGRVADAYGEKEAAIRHFQAAEALYNMVGDDARAEVVVQVLTRLIDSIKSITPHPSPTP